MTIHGSAYSPARPRTRIAALAAAGVVLAGPGARAQDLFELEVFRYESAPAGGHDVEFHVNTFNRSAFDGELQTLEIRPIIDYRQGRLWLAANPSLEMVTRGPGDGLEPTFDLSATAGWQLVSRLALTVDYFSRAATTRHLAPEADAHHLAFAGANVDVGGRWELSLGLGHCWTSHEPWLMKSIVGYRF